MEWDTNKQWRKQIERRLYELGSEVKGQVPIQADRIADVVEQIDEVRKELKRVSDKVDTMGEWIKKHVPRKGGDSNGSGNS